MCERIKWVGTKVASDVSGLDYGIAHGTGDVSNDTVSTEVADAGAVTGNVLDPSKEKVDHAIDSPDYDGAAIVSEYPGSTQLSFPLCP